jgi:uncharacterized protein YuzE
MVSAKFDPEVNALYLKFFEDETPEIEKTLTLGEGTYLDVTKEGNPVGIELILPESMPIEAIKPLSRIGQIKKLTKV